MITITNIFNYEKRLLFLLLNIPLSLQILPDEIGAIKASVFKIERLSKEGINPPSFAITKVLSLN